MAAHARLINTCLTNETLLIGRETTAHDFWLFERNSAPKTSNATGDARSEIRDSP